MARRPATAPVSAELRAPREAHPADARRADVLANPAGYTASIRANGRNSTLPAATLQAAATAAIALEAGARLAFDATTQATVYALPRDGGGPEVVARPHWAPLVSPDAIKAIVAAIARNLTKGTL